MMVEKMFCYDHTRIYTIYLYIVIVNIVVLIIAHWLVFQ
jgi:hypothetical protein